MLEHLYIKNVALIDEIEVDFKNGLNILSGETGAGKSIIIDSINFVLGERPGRDFIKKGQEKAIVEAIISINNETVKNEVNSYGINIGDDNSILISRILNINGKANCKINGKTVTITILKEISSFLIDIHGQHEHQSLLNPSKHIFLLDKFCSDELNIYKSKLLERYKIFKEISSTLNEISGNAGDREYKIDLYEYQLNEIEEADLKENEEEELYEKRKVLSNFEKLKSNANQALELLYRSEDMSAADRVSKALHNISEICSLDVSQQHIYDEIESVYVQLEDVVRQLRNYYDRIEDNPDELNYVEKRIDLIYELKRKYGSSIKEIMKFYEDTNSKLQFILNSEQEAQKLIEKKKKIEKEIFLLCDRITFERKKYSRKIQEQIINILNDLGMKNAKFEIDIKRKDSFSPNGRDRVEFLISPNPGEDLKPLAQIASGGEMSRVMLALKAVLAKADNIETFIFDEIDTGVSGRTAQQVAEKLAVIGINNQILCITHLPQIAAMGDSHYLIEKVSIDDKTNSYIKELNIQESICELARLIGGAEITDSTLKAAEEMKQMAFKLKKDKLFIR